MIRMNVATRLAVAAGSVMGLATAARGVDGPTAVTLGTPGNPDTFLFVGRVQTAFTAPNMHIGTGSYLGDGRVLTCAHVIDPHADRAAIGDFIDVNYEVFQIGVDRYSALGVQHPQYQRRLGAGGGLSTNDVGMMLVLNRPASLGADPSVAAVGSPVNTIHTVVGFTDTTRGAFASNKRSGRMRATGVGGGLYTYDRTGVNAGFAYTQNGDSGGPLLSPDGAGGWRIMGVVRSGNSRLPSAGSPQVAGTFSEAVRVDMQRPFIDGDGVAGQRVFTSFVDGANMNWETANRWGRSSAGLAQVPRNNDVVSLDPTSFADRDVTVTITRGTANLDGLLNDVTLDVQKGELRVAGTVGQSNGRRTGTGALNGGRIRIGGGAQAASMDIGWNMQNSGEVIVKDRGTARFGRSLPSGKGDTVLLNLGRVVVEHGGRVDVDLAMNSNGPVTVAGTMNAGRYLPRFFGAGPTLASPRAVHNWNRFDVVGGGVLTASNGVGKNTAVFHNHRQGATVGRLTVQGDNNGAAAANIDRLLNDGDITVGAGGNLSVAGGFSNRSNVTVTGSAAAGGVASGWILNDGPNARVTVGAGGQLNGRLPNPPYGTVYGGLENKNGARIAIRGGGVVDAAGRLENGASSRIEISSSATDGPGVLRSHSNLPGSSEAILQWGAFAFDTPAGASDARMEVTDMAWTLSTSALVSGRGTIEMKGAARLNIASDAGGNNWNDIHMVYNGARGTNNSFVNLEIASHDVGGANFDGLLRPFAMEQLCLMNNSRVRLTDMWNSEDPMSGSEVLYVEKLGVMAGSVLDLAGRKLYFKDFGCGGEFTMDRFVNGQPIRLVPTPGALMVLGLGLFAAARRRRTA
ncbi:hypothetical protein PHYC_00906 [Phycisphaerales bacterium]|nr:hypothetical protein PHYC_00906 [Phycisphaerales bacterium]